MNDIVDVRLEPHATVYYIGDNRIGYVTRNKGIVEATWLNSNGFETRSKWFNLTSEAFNWIVKLETGA